MFRETEEKEVPVNGVFRAQGATLFLHFSSYHVNVQSTATASYSFNELIYKNLGSSK